MRAEKILKRDLTSAGRRIVHSLIDCVAERGLAGTRIRDITDAAGTSEAAFYRFFPDLHQAVLYVIRRYYWRRLNQRLAAYRRVQHEPVRLLDHIIDELFASHADDPETAEDEAKVFRIVAREMSSPELGPPIVSDPEYRQFIHDCAAIIQRAQRQEKLARPMNARLAAELLAPLAHTILLLRTVPGVSHPTDVQARRALWQLLGGQADNGATR
jgi:AcrR family transcriptional regulator